LHTRTSILLQKRPLLGLFVLLIGVASLGATLKPMTSFEVPGPTGKRFDYLTIDYDDHYLLSAHLAAGLLYVIDLRTNKVLEAIPGVPGVEGVEFVPELKKVYTSDSGDNTIGVIDLKQMKVIKKLPTEAKPDGSAYAAPDRIDTIADFDAVKQFGIQSKGGADAATAAVVAELADLVAQGELEVPIAGVFALDDVREAYRQVELRHTRGKLVLRP
jgi:YVTN family beta-propeller protein